MAAADITPTALPVDGAYNLTDSLDFTTLVAGAGNGVTFNFDASDLVALKNGTAGAAVFTIKVRQDSKFSDKGITVPDETINVAAGKTFVMRMVEIFKTTAGKIIVECDVAGEVLVLDL